MNILETPFAFLVQPLATFLRQAYQQGVELLARIGAPMALATLLATLGLLALVSNPRSMLVRRFAAVLLLTALLVGALARPGNTPLRDGILIGILGLLPWAWLGFCAHVARFLGQRHAPAPRRLLRHAPRWLAQIAFWCAIIALAGWQFMPPLATGARSLLLLAQPMALALGCAFLLAPTRLPPDEHSQAAMPPTSTLPFASWWMSIAAACAFGPLALLLALPLGLTLPPVLPPVTLTPLAAPLLLFPLAVIIVAISWRPVHLIALIDRMSVYALLALALLALYALAGVLIEQALEHVVRVNAPSSRIGLALGLALLIALTYAPLRARLQRLVDTLLYRDYYALDQTVQRFSEALATAHDREDIAARLLDGLITTLNLNGAAFIALPEGLDPQVLQVLEPDDLRARREYASDVGRRAILRGLASLSLAEHALSWKKPLLLHPWEGCAALSLIGPGPDGTAVALLALGLKRAGSPLRREDRALLGTLAHQAAMALANAQLVEGLRISLAQTEVAGAQRDAARAEQQLLLREVVNADERQRAALARDLHDDALQEVLYVIRHAQLCRRLSLALDQVATQSLAPRLTPLLLPPSLLQQPPAAPENEGNDNDTFLAGDAHANTVLIRLRAELTQLAERSTIAERKLRALCLGLYPELLHSLGLVAALDDLAGQCALTTGMRVEAQYDDAVIGATDRLDPEVALHIYRITQEAFNNAHKHGQATAASARLRLIESGGLLADQPIARFLSLEIADDGSGIALPVAFGPLLREGHLGLASMRERAAQIGARLQFQRSAEGGTLVSLMLPLDLQIRDADGADLSEGPISAPLRIAPQHALS